MRQPTSPPKLLALPLAAFERDGLATVLAKAGLPADDVRAEGPLFWRFVGQDDVLAGFGGLEMHGRDVLLRSLVILPPLRRQHVGSAIVRLLEIEASMLGGRTVWLVSEGAALFFERLGYSACATRDVPKAIRDSGEFRRATGPTATAMTKRLG